MILGLGSDISDVRRVAKVIERHGDRFLARVYTDTERARAERKKNRVETYAKRFAAKEAAAKALKAPPGMIWQHCWIEKTEWGAPILRTEGTVAREAARQGIDRWHLSMSHDGGLAMAYVIAESTGSADPESLGSADPDDAEAVL